MNDPSLRNSTYQSLTDEQLADIDELCDRFDRELVTGGSPRIESYLAEVSEVAREGLLAELLAMKIEYRTRRGEVPRPDEYVERFPQQRGVIAGVFSGASRTQCRDDRTILNNSRIESPVEAPLELENFRLIKLLGSGGMGVVWLAEQDKPVKRRVALKLIKSEVPSKDVMVRFEAEKQALAMMDHPNIARVLDAGTTDDGRPYFVMELVEGVPITQYCDDNKLSVDERLKLFVPVCKAVQHAHQKGIVHRDLKPSNVLVTVVDGQPVPKVIDFGLAKAVEQNLMLSDATLQTEFGKVVGTVQYMSPEQAELRGSESEDIDTRTDVYSLGVMLYELLTGTTPLDKGTLGQNALLKVLQIIREDAPPRPSSRLSSASYEANSAVSDLRNVHPARLQQILRGELDWVVMKALEKDRARRYQTANDLAQELTNYLTGVAVAARPPSAWYQLQKFANRNRVLVAAVLAVSVALVAGIVGTTYGLLRANEKASEAEIERGKALGNEHLANLEKDKARSNEQRAIANEKRAVAAELHAEAESQRARDSEASAKFQLAVARWEAGRARDARDLLQEIPPEYRDNFEWRFCRRQFEGSDFTCYGHSQVVRRVAYSPNGTEVATASMDSTIKLWDARTGAEIKTLRGQEGAVHQVVFSPDGTHIASSGSDRTIRIWDIRTGEITTKLEGHEHYILTIAFTSDGTQLLSASDKATIRRWDAASGQEMSKAEIRQNPTGGAFSPDGSRFLSFNNSGLILWDTAIGREIRRQANTRPYPISAVFSADGRHVAVACHDTVTLWDSELTHSLWTGDGKAGWIRGLDFSPDGTRLATSGGDRKAHIWDVETGVETMTFVGHSDAVNDVAFSPDGARLATVSFGDALRLWDVRTGANVVSVRPHGSIVNGIVLSQDGNRLVSGGFDRKLKMTDVHTGAEIYSVNGHFNGSAPGSHTVAWSPDEAYIAFGADDNTVKLIDARTGAELKSLAGHESNVCTVAFSPDSQRVISGSFDHTIRVWDVAAGQEVMTLIGHTGRVNCVAISPDGTHIVSACEDRTIRFWDAQSGKELMSLVGHEVNVVDIAFSPDGSQIATSSSDHTIRIWDALTGASISRLNGHEAGVTGIAYSPDGSRIASTGFDRRLKLWDVPNGREIFTIHQGQYGAHGLTFSPDGTRIAAGMENGAIMFFDAPTEREATSLNGHTAPPIHFGFSDDGRRIYSESQNEKLVWDVARQEIDRSTMWESPADEATISPNGRWLLSGDRNDILLVDLEFKNTPIQEEYRARKAQFDSAWQLEQANAAAEAKNWFAATHHFALLAKNAPEQVAYHDGLLLSFDELKSQFEQAGRDLDPYLSPVVTETLKLTPVDERSNPSFEEPRIRKEAFEFRTAIPGWRSTRGLFEIWPTGFLGVPAYDGNQFVELNARSEGTLFKDVRSIQKDTSIEFTFAHRGRNGEDTLKLTITDLGADNAAGGGDDTELFAKEYTTGNKEWVVYDNKAEPEIKSHGNRVRFAFSAISTAGGQGTGNAEGNFLDAAHFGAGVVTTKQ
ncbi:MAG: protein kinase [Planctomycetaceae bacterium]